MVAEDRKAALQKCYQEAYHNGNFGPLDDLAAKDMLDHSVYRDLKAVPGLAGSSNACPPRGLPSPTSRLSSAISSPKAT